MHRLRMGLTGLGVVLLLVFIAAAGVRPDRPVGPTGAGTETLSTLGVAPDIRSQPATPPPPPPAKG